MSRNFETLDPLLSDGALRNCFVRLRGDVQKQPDASVVIPVNAKGDFGNARTILNDLSRYSGDCSLEIVFVVNNYDNDNPPTEIEELRDLGIRVIAEANVRIDGECIPFTARVLGVRFAEANQVVLLDADCRIPDATALLDWYIEQFRKGAQVAYTHVGYYDVRVSLPNRVRIWIHHAARWTKRALLGIPTLRGSNYAIERELLLRLYRDGWLADDMNVGPTCRAARASIAYASDKRLIVLTSGRMFSGTSWIRLNRYFWRRLRFNLRVLRVRPNAARYTRRELDPERSYVNNRPVC